MNRFEDFWFSALAPKNKSGPFRATAPAESSSFDFHALGELSDSWTGFQFDGLAGGSRSSANQATGARLKLHNDNFALPPDVGETLVNDPDGEQVNPTVAVLDNGNFVIVWAEGVGLDERTLQVSGQMFDSDGEKIGDQFLIGGTNALDGFEMRPAVIALDTGGFAVTWTEGRDNNALLSIYDQNGEIVADTLIVGQINNETVAGITQLDGGDIAVSYVSNTSGTSRTWQANFRRFDTDGTPSGEETTVFTGDRFQDGGQIAKLSDGGYVVGWSGLTETTQRAYVRVINADGTARSDVITASAVDSSAGQIGLVGLPDGGFVAAWSQGTNTGFDVAAQRFDADGNKIGDIFLINQTTAGEQGLPSLNPLEGGGFVVTWVTEGDDFEIMGREYDANAQPVGGEFAINTTTFGAHSQAYAQGTVGDFGNGVAIVVWSGNGPGDMTGIFYRTFSVTPGSGGDNTDPVATNDTAAVDEDGTVVISVLANDSDADMDALSISGVTDPANGTVVVNADGTITYTPDADFNGSDSFTYTVSDGNGGSDTASVSVTVNPVNDDPIATNDTAVVDEDGSVVISVLANDSDIDMDVLSISGVTDPGNGTVVINADGTITYTPDADFNGSDSFTYTVSDGNGGSDTASVSVTVNPLNDDPVANNDTAVVDEDGTVVISVLANDSDVDMDALSISGVTDPSNGTVVVNANGTITYTPDADFNGNDSFTYTISDGNGGSDTATVSVTVNPVNDDPVASDDTAVVDEDGTVVISVLANDSDADMDALSISGVTDPANGTVVVNADGTITYTPNADFSGDDSFTYTVSDGNGGSDTASVSVTVNPADNNRPIATDDTAAVNEDGSVVIAVLANDSDADMDALSISGVTDPANGTIVINADGTITYTPDADFNGNDSFTYTVSDGNGGSDTASVSVTVNPVNDDPIATNDTAVVDEDGSVVISVLANDSDIDMDVLSISGVTDPGNGTVVINADGTITYTPDAGFSGDDSFTYTVTDGNGGSDSASVSVTVNAVDGGDADAIDDAFATDEATRVTSGNVFDANPSSPDTNPDGDLRVTAVNGQAANVGVQIALASGALLTLNADGSFIYDPNGAFDDLPGAGSGASNLTATDSFTYELNGEDTATVTITINGLDSDGDVLVGTDGDDRLDGGIGADTMSGGLGDDLYFVDNAGDRVVERGDGGRDTVVTSVDFAAGEDEIEVIRAASDTGLVLTAGNIDTILNGGAGDDTLIGGTGNDNLRGMGGADVMSGGLGDDSYLVHDAGDVVIELAGEGRDTVFAYANFDANGAEIEVIRSRASTGVRLQASDIDTVISGRFGADALIGGDGDDVISGRGGDDRLRGGRGDDNLRGGEGNDVLIGGAGNDVLKGDQGSDMLEGGSGSDIFLFDDGDSSADLETADQILDFSQAEGDLINLARIDAVEGGGDDAFTFIGEAAFSGTAGELRFEQTDGQTHIFGDTDGNGIADFALVLDSTIPLTSADFTF